MELNFAGKVRPIIDDTLTCCYKIADYILITLSR